MSAVVILVTLAGFVISQLVQGIFNYFRKTNLSNPEKPIVYGPDSKYEPTERDLELIEQTKEILKDELPDGPITSIKNLSTEDRIAKMKQITDRVAKCYGVELSSIEFMSSEQLVENSYSPVMCGFYDLEENKIVLNLDLLACNDLDFLRDNVNTIVHELRHAYQQRIIREQNTQEVPEDKIRAWMVNTAYYFRPDRDPRSYYYQILEFDARNFAALATYDL
jgi:hypothetical protein